MQYAFEDCKSSKSSHLAPVLVLIPTRRPQYSRNWAAAPLRLRRTTHARDLRMAQVKFSPWKSLPYPFLISIEYPADQTILLTIRSQRIQLWPSPSQRLSSSLPGMRNMSQSPGVRPIVRL
jgi:hypothetical protein